MSALPPTAMNDSGGFSDPAINMADPFSTMDVPIGVPILQICTDIGPPAGIFTDKVLVSDKQRWLTVHDRTSPRVVNMLKGYTSFGFEDYVLDEELVELMGSKQTFWLNGMELFLKRG
jgi:hypothetical protein